MTDDVVLREVREGDEDVLYRAATELESWEQRSPRPPRPVSRVAFRAQRAERARGRLDRRVRDRGCRRRCGTVRAVRRGPPGPSRRARGSRSWPRRGAGASGTAALRQLVEFGLERWNLHRVHLIVLASNKAARRAYQKVGFVEEGVLREHAWVAGRWDDEVRMGLLRAEWRAARG